MDLDKISNIIGNIKMTSEQTNNIGKSKKDIKDIILNIKKASFKKDKVQQLQKKIIQIKSAFMTNWETDNIPFIENILNNIDIHEGIPLPILSICGHGTQEIRFTKYLSYFLDSNKKHGLQDKLLKTIFNPECELSDFDSNWSESCEVIPEIKLGVIQEENKKIGCYADIGIVGEEYIIIVEQKILSDESKHPDTDMNQLERYNIALNNNLNYKDKKKVKIYLTTKRNNNKNHYGWLPLTHEEVIDRGINLLKSNDISNIGKENLMRLLIDLAVGPYEIVEESLDEIILLGNKLVNEKFHLGSIVRFNKLIDENKKVIEILLEG
ncbi:MAG: PD-(D/E)XK nuclease family protein [Gudongella sp.]|nr:PD-(D/E)XK nuclease family protein [Gudongella sp.]